jgi:hypothetical protein
MIPALRIFGRKPLQRVTLSDHDINKTGFGSGSVTASFSMNTSGGCTDQDGTLLETWLLLGAASDYEVRATVASGSVTSGTTGAWLSLASGWSWTRRSTASVILTIEIRDAATTRVLVTATITITAACRGLERGGGEMDGRKLDGAGGGRRASTGRLRGRLSLAGPRAQRESLRARLGSCRRAGRGSPAFTDCAPQSDAARQRRLDRIGRSCRSPCRCRWRTGCGRSARRGDGRAFAWWWHNEAAPTPENRRGRPSRPRCARLLRGAAKARRRLRGAGQAPARTSTSSTKESGDDRPA